MCKGSWLTWLPSFYLYRPTACRHAATASNPPISTTVRRAEDAFYSLRSKTFEPVCTSAYSSAFPRGTVAATLQVVWSSG